MAACAHYRIGACWLWAACLLTARCLPAACRGGVRCLRAGGVRPSSDLPCSPFYARSTLALRSLCARSALRALRAARARHRAGVFGIAEDPSCHAGTVVKWEFWHRQNSLMPRGHSSNNNLNHLEIRFLQVLRDFGTSLHQAVWATSLLHRNTIPITILPDFFF